MAKFVKGACGPDYIFVSMGRCGTTLFQNILNSHPKLYLSDECHWFPDLNKAGLLYHQFVEANDLSKTSVNYSSLWWEGVKAMHETLFDKYSGMKWGLQVIGKRNKAIVSQLLALFPDAKVILLLRDPRDLYLSLIRTGIGHRSAASDLKELYLEIKKSGRQHKVITYEKLCAYPEFELTEICSFLGEEFFYSMLTPLTVPVSHGESAALSLSGPYLSKNNVDKRWLLKLDTEELLLLNSQYESINSLSYPVWSGSGEITLTAVTPAHRAVCFGFSINLKSKRISEDGKNAVFSIEVKSVGAVAISGVEACSMNFGGNSYSWCEGQLLPVQLIDLRDVSVERSENARCRHVNYKEVRSLPSVASILKGKKIWLYSAGSETLDFMRATYITSLFEVAGVLDISARLKKFEELYVLPIHTVSPSNDSVVLIPTINHYVSARRELEYAGWIFGENMFLVQ